MKKRHPLPVSLMLSSLYIIPVVRQFLAVCPQLLLICLIIFAIKIDLKQGFEIRKPLLARHCAAAVYVACFFPVKHRLVKAADLPCLLLVCLYIRLIQIQTQRPIPLPDRYKIPNTVQPQIDQFPVRADAAKTLHQCIQILERLLHGQGDQLYPAQPLLTRRLLVCQIIQRHWRADHGEIITVRL